MRVAKPVLTNNWLLDEESDHRWILHRIRRHPVSARTNFQQLDLIDTYNLGTVLVLDGKIQSASTDEHIYHEALVHPAMTAHPGPRDVLILGGGEGATLREVLKHKTVRNAVMVDIDKKVINLSKKHLKKWHRGAFKDRRARVIIADARKFIREGDSPFDVIIADISDPTESGHASVTYTKEFYRAVLKRLSPDGIFVTQATEVFFYQPEVHSIIHRTVASVFPITESYMEYIPSFSSLWGFVAGSKGISLKGISPDTINKHLRERKVKTRYYSGETHLRLFSLLPEVHRMIKRQKRIATVKDPIAVHHAF